MDFYGVQYYKDHWSFQCHKVAHLVIMKILLCSQQANDGTSPLIDYNSASDPKSTTIIVNEKTLHVSNVPLITFDASLKMINVEEKYFEELNAVV